MHRRTLNLGILAHVDAGKTTLTERLLYAAGVIDEIGSVDAGTTQTDSLELERQRGITIRSAVVSFPIDDVTVNLIDTPGHPDFIAEVERVLSVLDGAVLVMSAVEGVQPQTRVLMRALQRLRVPTLLFVNKIDRRGADPDRVLAGIARRLTATTVPMGSVAGAGTRSARFVPWSDAASRPAAAEVLAAQDDELLAAYVQDGLSGRRLRAELARQTARARVHPVFFGSAVTGAGVDALTAGLTELLPAAAGEVDGPPGGQIFKIERGPTGEKVAYVRLFAGTVRTRERLHIGPTADKVTAIAAFDGGAWVRRPALRAGEIGQVRGLTRARVGDLLGRTPAMGGAQFSPPTLETVVVPRRPEDRGALRAALAQLAEQDPLINVRQDDVRHELSVSLYGEVQKEVIQATLASDFGVDVTFRATTTLCIERPVRRGEAVEVLNAEGNPFLATIGLRVEPAAAGSGIAFRLCVDARTVPMFIYKSVDTFADTMEQYVRATLGEGLFGWPVSDCTVTMFRCAYSSFDGPPSTRGPLSTAADYRRLTPMVLMRALERAGSAVCEPTVRVTLEIPTGTIGPVLAVLGRLGATVHMGQSAAELSIVEAVMPASRVPDLQRHLPGLTSGEGVLEARFEAYAPVTSDAPTRPRTTVNPLHREEYLAHLRR